MSKITDKVNNAVAEIATENSLGQGVANQVTGAVEAQLHAFHEKIENGVYSLNEAKRLAGIKDHDGAAAQVETARAYFQQVLDGLDA